MISRFKVPDLGIGVGYRVPHYRQVVEARPAMPWFEILSENFMVEGGSPAHWLEQLSAQYPLVPHGVSLSLGGEENPAHTQKLIRLLKQLKPPWFSDHLCWTGTPEHNLHELIPIPYTPALMAHMVDRIRALQDQTGLLFAVENVSAYLSYKNSSLSEWDFLGELCERADCGILLDVNNIFVSANNLGFDPITYLNGLPLDRVVQIHLAGHTVVPEGYRLDTHDHPICEDVWQLYRAAIARIGSVSTLIEWDGNIPSWERLSEEAALAASHREAALQQRISVPAAQRPTLPIDLPFDRPTFQHQIADWIRGDVPDPSVFAPSPAIPPDTQIAIYQRQYKLRLYDALVEDVPGVVYLLGESAFETLHAYLAACPSQSWTLSRLPDRLPAWLSQQGADPAVIAMAQLEVAVAEVFEAAAGAPLSLAQLSTFPPLKLAPHVRLLRLGHNVHHLRSALLEARERPTLLAGDFPVILFRRGIRVRHADITSELFEVLRQIGQGISLADALETVVMVDPARIMPEVAGWFQQCGEAAWLQAQTEDSV